MKKLLGRDDSKKTLPFRPSYYPLFPLLYYSTGTSRKEGWQAAHHTTRIKDPPLSRLLRYLRLTESDLGVEPQSKQG